MWDVLKRHRDTFKASLTDLFKTDAKRHLSFSRTFGPLYFDFSKTHLTSETLDLLLSLAKDRHVEAAREALFSGKHVNTTENRAALHPLLRAPKNAQIYPPLQPIQEMIHQELTRLETFVTAVTDGDFLGFSGERITDIVNIGIGGSDLGPRVVVDALNHLHTGRFRCHFVANADASDLIETLQKLNPKTTLFLVASKSFTTAETLLNAKSAREWLLRASQNENSIRHHFVAITAHGERAAQFGIPKENCFALWDFIGGRYSLWSSIGLPILFAIGIQAFRELLAGAHAIDQHFCEAPLAENIPVLLALIGVWYRNFWGTQSHAILPYDHHLRFLPNYLQQLEMESLGKSVDQQGNAISQASGPVIWGGVGTNSQHAFFQLIHQGSVMMPCDFILMRESAHPRPEHHLMLYANALAQMQAFMQGKSSDAARQELIDQGFSEAEIEKLLPHKIIPGNKPSIALVFEKLTPYTLGMLLALYEHKVFVQSVVWNINAFDQWGVELGKQLSDPILNALQNQKTTAPIDSSTAKLIELFKA